MLTGIGEVCITLDFMCYTAKLAYVWYLPPGAYHTKYLIVRFGFDWLEGAGRFV